MSDIAQPLRNWIYFRHTMKGLVASLSLSLSSVAPVRELISPSGLLTSYLARNWIFFLSVELSICFRILRKCKCTCWSQGTPFSSSESLRVKWGGELFFILLPVPLQLLLWRKECVCDTCYVKSATLFMVRMRVNLRWLSGPVGLHKLNSKFL